MTNFPEIKIQRDEIYQTKKEPTMRTIDLSLAMIGKTIRIEKEGIAGTHNYIEGILYDFDFSTENLLAMMGDDKPVNVIPVDIEATIAGLTFNLTGKEPLHVVSQG